MKCLFRYLWSPNIFDLWSSNQNKVLNGEYKYQNNNLQDNIENEVSFDCDKYFLINSNYLQLLNDKFL
jgi:hypothetical protein